MLREHGKQTFHQGWENLRNDYAAAKNTRYRRRRTGVSAAGSNADYHYKNEADFLRILEAARDMDRNDCIVGQTIDRAVTNTIQDGFRVDPQTGDKKLDAELALRWAEWSSEPEACDIAGELNFNEQEQFGLRHTLVDGDILSLGLAAGQLQFIEGHRIRTPRSTKRNVVHGVLLDQFRRHLEYWVTREDVDLNCSVLKVGDTTPYPVRDDDGYRQVFHLRTPKRVTQTRGISALAPIFDVAGMFEDIQFAKLVQQQVVSCFAIFRERPPDFAGGAPPQTGARATETMADGGTRTIDGIAPGIELTGQPGETLRGFSPNVPNAEYFEHVRLILTLVGINLGMPLVLVLLDASQTNFSGWRGAIDQARQGFRRNQRAMISRFHRPVYRWQLRKWMEQSAALRKAEAALGPAFYKHVWNTPGWPYIEPLKDAQGDDLQLRANLTSPRRLQAGRGRDWEQLATEIVEDRSLLVTNAIAKAAEINAAFPDAEVDWRELAGVKPGAGRQNARPAGKDKQPGRNGVGIAGGRL